VITSADMINDNSCKWSESMKMRHSVRRFSGARISDDTFKGLKRFVKTLSRISIDPSECKVEGLEYDNGIRVYVGRGLQNDMFKGLIGGYGKIMGATGIAVFIGDSSDPRCEEKAGYLGEATVLEATSLGLGSCWVAGNYSKGRLQAILSELGYKETGNERIYAVAALGYTMAGFGESENLMKGLVKSKNKKDLHEISPDYDRMGGGSGLPEWFIGGLEAVRIAPSANNMQPWIYRYLPGPASFSSGAAVRSDRVLISLDTKGLMTKFATPRIDCGISMLHFQVGAHASGASGYWSFSRYPDIAVFSINEYK
jgi:nitroreductase